MILEIMAILVVFIAIFTFLFLFIGLKVNINLNKESSDFKGQIEIKWAFIKIFSKKFPDNDTEVKVDKKEDKKRNKNNESKKTSEHDDNKKKNQFNDFKSVIILIKKNFDDIFDLFFVCINSIKLEKFNTNISLGFSSPVDTVNVVAHIWAFSAIPNLSKHFYLSAVPVFTKETIDFNSELSFKINLLRPALKLLRLITKKSMIELILKLRKLSNNG